jgi:hypothetical protein
MFDTAFGLLVQHLAVGAEYMYPFRRVTVQNRAVGTCGVRWRCEKFLSRRRGAGGLGR